VLVADDNADMRQYLNRLLAPRYDVILVADGEAALAAIREHAPDLVLSDVMMPRLDGLGLLSELRADGATRAIPVVLLSARAGEEARVEGLNVGADDYVIKPFSARELLARVESQLNLARLRRETAEQAAADLQAMTVLHEVGTLCVRVGNNFTGCVQAIVDAAIAITGADKANLQVLDPASGGLRIIAHRGFDPPFLAFFDDVRNDASACRAAHKSAQRIVVEDVSRSEIFAGQPSLTVLLDAGVHAVQSIPLLSARGNVLGMLSIHFCRRHSPSERELRLVDLLARQAADYLERKKVDADLRESEARDRARVVELETLFATVPSPIWVSHDAECSHVTGNPAANALLGVPAGANVSTSTHPGEGLLYRILRDGVEVPTEQLPMARAARERLYITGEEYEVAFDDGRRACVLIHARPLFGEAGNVCGGIAAGIEITERKATEQRLRQAYDELRAHAEQLDHVRESLERSNRAKDEFLAMLGHELRNPLSAVRNAVVAASLDESKRSRALEIARRQTDQLGRLIDDLLDVARITHGRVALHREPLYLSDVIKRAVDSTHLLFESRGIHVAFALEPRPLQVSGDPVRLEQVFVNLLSNAAKYTDVGGRTEVVTEKCGDEIVVRIRDSGIGIAHETLPHIWDLFMQAERALDRAPGGLGIGLTVARRLVELHGGRIEARSEGIGKGAEFVVTLAALPQTPGPTLTSHSESASQPAARVLLVEDQPDTAETLTMLLELLGHQVRSVPDGTAALEAVRTAAPDVMIVDIGLPGIDGYEVARRVRDDPTLDDVLLVALTGYGRDEDKRKALAAGFDHHLVKPVTPDTLNGLVARLGSSKATSEPRKPTIH
jgi:signal transduction histidine kinase/DNA-binding response OmpR family regulator